MTHRALDLLKNPSCGAVVSVPRELLPKRRQTADLLDLRFQSGCASPFGSLEDLEKIAGLPFMARPEILAGTKLSDKLPGGLDAILRIRKIGYRVLCIVDDNLPVPPAFNDDEIFPSRLFLTARYFPDAFVELLSNERFVRRLKQSGESLILDLFCDLCGSHDADTLKEILPSAVSALCGMFGELAANRIFARVELRLGFRNRMSLGIYDHALQMAGGGQKYACTMASALQNQMDVTFIANKPVSLEQLEQWYGLDLGRCRIKIVPLPFYEQRRSEFIDQGMAKYLAVSPFAPVSEESKRYDVFVNVNMITMLKPLSPVSVFLCHFPDSKRGRHFAVDEYTHVVANSNYTIEWLKKRWDLKPSCHIYPPADMANPVVPKEKIILSVARFEASGTKKQLELIEAFCQLKAKGGTVAADWKLILAGGSFGRNFYLKKVMRRAISVPGVEVQVNLTAENLRSLYARASIFWHACGLGEKMPERVEHFGMTTVEAMQNGCVPVVINKGGQKEIVESGVSGFVFDDLKGLCETTLGLFDDTALLERLSRAACIRAEVFSRARFEREALAFFESIRVAYI